MEINFITIQVSAPKYWGFRYKVPLEYALSVTKETLVLELKLYMKNFFNTHNLQELKDGVDELNLHFHQDILPYQTIIYVCVSHNTEHIR
jgi:hypothetical protein